LNEGVAATALEAATEGGASDAAREAGIEAAREAGIEAASDAARDAAVEPETEILSETCDAATLLETETLFAVWEMEMEEEAEI
jgi:hypothetical protein